MLLHIANGDAVGKKLKESGLPDDALVWREMYTEGPIAVDPEAPASLAARAAELERRFGIPGRSFAEGCEAQSLAPNGVDQWLGGARLTGTSPQRRWDEATGELHRMPPPNWKNL